MTRSPRALCSFFSKKKMEGHCPISHIPLRDLRMPVVFQNFPAIIVYDAPHVIEWLQNSMRNPMSNAPVKPGPAASILCPYRLPHTTEHDLARTRRFLEKAGCLGANSPPPLILLVLLCNLLAMHNLTTNVWTILVLVCLEFLSLFCLYRANPAATMISLWISTKGFLLIFVATFTAEILYWLSAAPPGVPFRAFQENVSCTLLRGYLHDYYVLARLMPVTPLVRTHVQQFCA